ncbi:MAG: DUF1905 domain-containing protein [Cytophagaceae bacterium]
MTTSNKPIFSSKVNLERFPGKGGWTYARVELSPDIDKPLVWRKVNGTIDDLAVEKLTLMPMGDGKLFIAVKAEIRKKIKKDAGDSVTIILYEDAPIPEDIPEDFILCLQDDSDAWRYFTSFSEEEKIKYVHWIYSAKDEDEIVERMAEAINRISRNIKLKN